MSGTKIKAIALIILIATCLHFAACTAQTEEEYREYKRQSEWCGFERITSDGVHTIYAHKATGVCYMFGNYGSLTVMLNPDGTAVTIDQITEMKGE